MTGGTTDGETGGGLVPVVAKAAPGAAGEVTVESVKRKFERALRRANGTRRLTEFLVALEGMTAEEAPKLRELINQLDREGMEFPQEWMAFTRKWGEVDGPAAAEYALAHAGEGWAGSGMRDIFSGWASADPTAAAAWLNAHGDNPHFDAALEGIVTGMADTDPAAATRVALASLPEGHLDLASKLTEQLAEAVVRQQSAPGMVAWYDGLPAEGGLDSVRNAAFPHVWSRLRHAGMEQATAWLETQADKPWRSDRQFSEATIQIADKNPAAALDWAARLPPSPHSDPARGGEWPGVNVTVSRWISQDKAAAEAYVSALPDTPFGKAVRRAHFAFTRPSEELPAELRATP